MNYILITGLPGAGKTTVCGFIREITGLHSINSGDTLREYALNRGLSCESRAEIGPVFLNRFSDREIYHILLEQALSKHAPIIDGVRLAVTCRQFLRENESSRVWNIQCEAQRRKLRLRTRLLLEGHSHDRIEKLLEKYRAYDRDENEIRSLSDLIIENNGSFEELQKRIRSVFPKTTERSGSEL